MSEKTEYQMLELPGSLLKQGFSVYLLEIVHKEKRLFYVGMTGDKFYPSARAAFHRVSGHLELSDYSTQNQLMKALRVYFKRDSIEDFLDDLIIKMHHFPIAGYKPWKGSKKHELIQLEINSAEYQQYQKRQREIHEFEDAIIFDFEKKLQDRLLNKTKGKKADIAPEFQNIYSQINKLMGL